MTITTGYFSNAAGNQALALILLQSGLYLAAHLSEPGAIGDGATEAAGGDYERQPVTFSAPNGKACANNKICIFTGMDESDVTWLAVWNAISGGTMQAALELSPAITVPQSGQLRVEVGDAAWQL